MEYLVLALTLMTTWHAILGLIIAALLYRLVRERNR